MCITAMKGSFAKLGKELDTRIGTIFLGKKEKNVADEIERKFTKFVLGRSGSTRLYVLL